MEPVSIPADLRSYASAQAFVRKRRLAEHRASLPSRWIRLAEALFEQPGRKMAWWWGLVLSPLVFTMFAVQWPSASDAVKIRIFLVMATVSMGAGLGTGALLSAWIVVSERRASSPYRATRSDLSGFEAVRDPRLIALEVLDRLQVTLRDGACRSNRASDQEAMLPSSTVDEIRKEIDDLREWVCAMPPHHLPQPPVSCVLRPPIRLSQEVLFMAEVAHRYDAILAKVLPSR